MRQDYILVLGFHQYWLAVELAYSIAFQLEGEAVHFEVPAKVSMAVERGHSIVNQIPMKENTVQMKPHPAQMKRHSQRLRSDHEELFRIEDDLVHVHFQREEQFHSVEAENFPLAA
jgi:hypothetical protein